MHFNVSTVALSLSIALLSALVVILAVVELFTGSGDHTLQWVALVVFVPAFLLMSAVLVRELYKRALLVTINTYAERIHQRRIDQWLFPVQAYLEGTKLFVGKVERQVEGKSFLSMSYPGKASEPTRWRSYRITETSIDVSLSRHYDPKERSSSLKVSFSEARIIKTALKGVATVTPQQQKQRAELEGQAR